MRPFQILAVCLTMAGAALADDDEFGKEQIEKWGAYYQSRAKSYDIRLANGADQSLTFHPQPVLHWSNPVISNGSTHGECYLWTRDGRPEVFASIFSYRSSRQSDQNQRVVAHVFNTLSREALVASHGGEVFWRPDDRRVEEFLPIPDVPAPAGTRAGRLTQLRRLAREFSATSGGSGNDEELDLRLLPQPVYRNQQESGTVLDGGLFVFVTGTDPELLLMIEAQRSADASGWYAVATRHSHLTLRLEHRGREVWRYVRNEPNSTSPQQHSYLSQHGVDYQNRLLP